MGHTTSGNSVAGMVLLLEDAVVAAVAGGTLYVAGTAGVAIMKVSVHIQR